MGKNFFQSDHDTCLYFDLDDKSSSRQVLSYGLVAHILAERELRRVVVKVGDVDVEEGRGGEQPAGLLRHVHHQVVLAQVGLVVNRAGQHHGTILRVDAELGRLLLVAVAVTVGGVQRVAQVLLVERVRVERLGTHLDHVEADRRVLGDVHIVDRVVELRRPPPRSARRRSPATCCR